MFNFACKGSRPFILLTLFYVCFAGAAFAQVSSIPDSASQTGFGGTHAIVGTVFGPSGSPIESRIRVRLSSMTKGDRTATTNETGNFAFRGLPNGSYTISVDREKEFEPVSQSVDIRVIGDSPRGQTYTLNIRLAFKDSKVAKPAVLNAEFANVPAPARVYYDAAVELGKKGEHAAAVEQLKLAIKEYPKFTLAYNEMGVQHLRLGQMEDADAAFQQALKVDPNSFAALINRGIANVSMKRHGEAIPILRKAVKINEKSAVGHYFLGQALANLGLFDDAEKELQYSLQLGKEEMKEAHRILAIIYADRGAKAQAAGELETYLKLTPDAPDAENLKEMIRKLKGVNE
jgi:tetratricopeptide (TPR) repeat protein